MKIEDDAQLKAVVEEIEAKMGLKAWQALHEYYQDVVWRLTEKIKALKESRNKWKKLSMCSRCHKIIEEKDEKDLMENNEKEVKKE